jgi:hypothetical protein
MLDLIALARANKAIAQKNIAVGVAAILTISFVFYIVYEENEKRKKNGGLPWF